MTFRTLNPPLSCEQVNIYEKNCNISFPEGYRQFLTEIGNGAGNSWDSAGIGPDLGIIAITLTEDKCFIFDSLEIDLQVAFPYTNNYNLPDSEKLYEKFQKWFDKYTLAFFDAEKKGFKEPSSEEIEIFFNENGENPSELYFQNFEFSGVLPICGIGCGEYYFLVISGQSKGEIWVDSRDNWDGISPLLDEKGNRYQFDTWYLNWLNEEIKQLKSKI